MMGRDAPQDCRGNDANIAVETYRQRRKSPGVLFRHVGEQYAEEIGLQASS